MFQLTVQHAAGTCRIQVEPGDHGRLLTQVLRRAELPLNTRCDQRGLCNGCQFHLRAGHLQDAITGQVVSPPDPEQLLRGCQVRVPETGQAEIQIPPRSLLAHQPQVVTSFRMNVPRAHAPLWQLLELPAASRSPSSDINTSLEDRIAAALDVPSPVRLEPSLVAPPDASAAPGPLAVQQYGDHWLAGPVTAQLPAFGAAIDVGTTTVVVALVDLATGAIAASASALNGQTRLGDNVLTRINACMTKPHMVQRMQRAITHGTLQPLLEQALAEAGVSDRQLVCLVLAGNATMLHLVAGVNPAPMGIAPFTPVFTGHQVRTTAALGLEFTTRDVPTTVPPPGADTVPRAVHLLPGAAAYVGADITAGVLASGMAYEDHTCLLVDLGTNGELVLKHEDQLLGCATAAGPAFEGAGMTFGVRAGRGAISHLWLAGQDHDVHYETIGQAEPIGLCGTAYLDFLARGRGSQLLGPTGRFAADFPPNRVTRHPKHGLSLVVTQTAAGEPILITEADVASLLQAKAAIAAGIVCLLRRARLTAADVQRVYLAGGFGFHMHADSLTGCGMFPGFHPDQIEMVGNTSLAGAYLALLDSGALDQLNAICDRLQIIELNLEPDFETTYIDQLFLPDGV